jgi:hypothetical protein
MRQLDLYEFSGEMVAVKTVIPKDMARRISIKIYTEPGRLALFGGARTRRLEPRSGQVSRVF